MPKRKREDDSLEARLAQSHTELLCALKTAKAFERQRQSKRARDPAATADKKARIDREVTVLKSLDLSRAATAHLAASILKHKPIAAVADKLPESVRIGVPKPENLSEQERAALHNVTSNLYNQPGVRAVVGKLVLEVCRRLGVEEPRKGKQRGKDKVKGGGEGGGEGEGEGEAKSKAKREASVKDAGRVAADVQPQSSTGEKNQGKEIVVEAEDEDGDGAGDGDEEEWGGFEEGSDGSDDDDGQNGGAPLEVDSDVERAEEAILAKYDRMLGGSSDSESDGSDDDDNDDDSDDDPIKPTLLKRCSKPRFTDDGISLSSRSPSPDVHQGPSLSPEPAPPSKKAKHADKPVEKPPAKIKTTTTKTKDARPGTSTFLPSLMGGYVSGSESEASDIDVAPAKKRLGQRQRQAIWEKKYGAGANHIKKQMQQDARSKAGRDAGWDMRRGAVGDEGQRRTATPWKKGVVDPLSRTGGQMEDDAAGKGSASAAPAAAAPRQQQQRREVPKKDAPLHPSWAAKARQKEMEAKAKAVQGKKPAKVVFDD